MKNTLEKIVASDSEELKNLIDSQLSYFHNLLSGLAEDIHIIGDKQVLSEAITYEAAKKILPGVDSFLEEGVKKVIPLTEEMCLPFLMMRNIYTFQYQDGNALIRTTRDGVGMPVNRFGKWSLEAAADYGGPIRTPLVNDLIIPSYIKTDFDISDIYRQALFTYRHSVRDVCKLLLKTLKDLEALSKDTIKNYGKETYLLSNLGDPRSFQSICDGLQTVLEFTGVESIFRNAIWFPAIQTNTPEGEATLERSLDLYRKPCVALCADEKKIKIYGMVLGIREPAELLYIWVRRLNDVILGASVEDTLSLIKDLKSRVKHVKAVVTC